MADVRHITEIIFYALSDPGPVLIIVHPTLPAELMASHIQGLSKMMPITGQETYKHEATQFLWTHYLE